MTYFCTLFDSFYLSRGLMLYDSLKENIDRFHIYIFAFDLLSFNILIDLKLEHATIISLREFENEDLLNVKSSRTRAEYCWTCTSSVIEFVLDNYDVPSCTYLDADLFFYKSPQILLNELNGAKNVMITEHRFSKFAGLLEQKRAGRFCVQFITFNNAPDSRLILKKWISQCIEWCYARYENGKFGDQKYLESWPDEYPNVHILENKGGGVAPWNAIQFKFTKENNIISGLPQEENNKFEVVFFHFHYIKILLTGCADLGWNRLQKNVIEIFYKPYLQELIKKEKFLQDIFTAYKTVYVSEKTGGLKEAIKYLYKNLTRFNLIKLSDI